MDRDESRRESLVSWQRLATGWERRRTTIDEVQAPVGEWLVRALAPQPGETILELAAGAGETGFAAAALVGDEGRLISTDFSAEMLDLGRRRAAERGLGNVEFSTMDAEQLELDDGSVDGVICRFGFMLMTDRAAALAETRRVLRPGGRLVLATWRGPEQNPWLSATGRVLVERGHLAPPDPEAPGPYTMSTDEQVRSLLGAAGFTDVRIDDVPVLFVYSDIDDYIETARDTRGTFATAFAYASEEEHTVLTLEIAEALQPYAVDGGYELPGLALVAVAR